MIKAEKVASKFRNENEIHKGNRIILVHKDNREEEIASIQNVSIKYYGRNSLIKIHEGYNIAHASLSVGEAAYIEIGSNFNVRFNLNIDAKTNNVTVVIGSNANIGQCNIVSGDEDDLEVIIGDKFLAATDIFIRNSDSHTIYDIETKTPINIPKFGVHIGNNVWCGYNVTVLKDANIPDNCVVGACSVVGHKDFTENSVIAGIPAKTIRTDVMWDSRTVTQYSKLSNEEIDKRYFEDNFFVISSDDRFEDITPRMYGYFISNDKILINSHNCNYNFSKYDFGVYINVTTDEKEVNIYQDYFGSYGLHLYRNGSYWAISNSLIYLVNYLSDKKEMTFDAEFAKAFLAPPTAALSYHDTMIKEIVILPRNCSVNIDKIEKTLDIRYFEQKESYIPIDSKEAIDIIDTWHKKWNNIINTLIKSGEYVTCDLSGGKDSRASFTSLFSKRLDLNAVQFNSTNDQLYTHSEDYKIASKIAEKYGFSLNETSRKSKKFKMDPIQNMNASLLMKCGFHKELMFTDSYNQNAMFRITGSGGEALRDHWRESTDVFIENTVKYANFNSVDTAECLKKMMLNTIEQENNLLGKNLSCNDCFYKNVRMRYHFGKGQAELFMANDIWLAPLLDPVIYSISQDIGRDNDFDLLYAVIYDRFIPEIDDIAFDSKRTIDEKTWEVAREINKKYPYKIPDTNEDFKIEFDCQRFEPSISNSEKTALDYLKELFYSDAVKDFVCGYLGEEVYIKADRYYRTTAYHPYLQAACLVEIYMIYKLAAKSRGEIMPSAKKRDFFVPKQYSNNGFMREVFDFFNSARLDIKNIGGIDNDVVIVSKSDNELYTEVPNWWTDKTGKGRVFQSTKGKLEMKLRTIGNGKLCIKLLSPYIKDNDGKVLPIKTDFAYFILKNNSTDEIVFSNDNAIYTADSNHPKIFETECTDGQVFTLELKWVPYIYAPGELQSLLGKLYYKAILTFKYWKPNI